MAYRETDGELASFVIMMTVWALMLALMLYGWIANIVTLWSSFDDPLTAKMIVRLAGIFVFPLGAILGYL